MSMLPLLLSTLWADFDRPYRAIDQNPALAAFHSGDFMFPRAFEPNWDNRMVLDFYYRPWMDLFPRRDGGTISVTNRDGKFTVVIDARRFEPEEISVKVVDRCIVVEAKHEEKKDEHGIISRQFIRRYLLPDQADVEQVSATISSDRVLIVTAPLTKKPEVPTERTIKIELTGQPAFKDGPGIENRDRDTTEANASSSSGKKTVEENEIREEVTTQRQEDAAKPVK